MEIFRIPAVKSICLPAKRRAQRMGSLRQSIRNGDGNYAGCIFEEAWMHLMGGERVNSYEYDFIMPQGWMPKYPDYYGPIDLKAKERKVEYVKPDWEVSVADHAGRGKNQQCNAYAFGSVYFNSSDEPTWIWFLGGISKQRYFYGNSTESKNPNELDCKGRELIRFENLKDGAEFRKEGLEYDDNRFVCKEDCWNRKFSYLDHYIPADLSIKAKIKLRQILEEARSQEWGGTNEFLLKGRK